MLVIVANGSLFHKCTESQQMQMNAGKAMIQFAGE